MITEPLTLPSGLVLRNRLAKAALTEALASPDGMPTPALLRYSRLLSEGGAGLYLTGNVMVDRRYVERAGNVIIEDDTELEALSRWADSIQGQGTAALVQLSHPGRQVNRLHSGRPVAPSAGEAVHVMGFFAAPRALEVAEIRDVIARFVRAAQVIERTGFAGVQVH
ncbi:MAG: oxidase, partial [Myxococcaceae bacterium]|nr:oxidase [Myxococcaceae bacterium]